MRKFVLSGIAALFILVAVIIGNASAQNPPTGAQINQLNIAVTPSCNAQSLTQYAGVPFYGLYMDYAGNLCTSGSGPRAVTTTPGQRTLVTLDVKTVTTGGTAVTALIAGHKTAGGWLQNPPSASINLCINEIGTAAGTTSSGDTTCITPGSVYKLTPGAGAVSVISSDNTHPFSGMGWQ